MPLGQQLKVNKVVLFLKCDRFQKAGCGLQISPCSINIMFIENVAYFGGVNNNLISFFMYIFQFLLLCDYKSKI